MGIDWAPLRQEFAVWRAEKRALTFWWRDDDAVTATPDLARLCNLADRTAVPLHLAVIPARADASLKDVCAAPDVVPMVHGWAHQNHALDGEKKSEFGTLRDGLAKDAGAGLTTLTALFGAELLPVFVPPWNRVHADLIPRLAGLGFCGVSTYTPRASRMAAEELVQTNTHIDPIDWRGGGGLVAEEALLDQLVTQLRDRRAGRADGTEPLGLLTHHLVHDAAIWGFVEALILEFLEGGAMPVNLMEMKDNLP